MTEHQQGDSSQTKRRRVYWINPDFQSRFRRDVLLLALNEALALTLLSLSVSLALYMEHFLPTTLAMPFGFTMIAVLVVVYIVYKSTRLSHKMCGPIYRILCELERVRNGERPGPIKLRAGDEFQELADALNETFEIFQAAPTETANIDEMGNSDEK